MERRLLLAAFVVGYGLIPVQLNKEMGTKADTREPNGPSRIQEDFRHLFDSIKRNDARRSENYRDILKQEAIREQHAFDTMKEDLWFGRQKNAHRQKTIGNNEEGLVLKRETLVDNNRTSGVGPEENTGNDAENSASDEPISPDDPALVTGLEEMFTTKRAYRPRAPLKWKSRAMSVMRERHRSILEATTYRIKNARTKPGPVSENPLATDLERRIALYDYLMDSFGRNDTEKKGVLGDENSPQDMYSQCYVTIWQAFMKHCFQAYRNSYKYGAGLLDVRALLARACKVDWIATNEMKEILLEACSIRRRLDLD